MFVIMMTLNEMIKVCPECRKPLKVQAISSSSLKTVYSCVNKECLYYGLLTVVYDLVDAKEYRIRNEKKASQVTVPLE